MDLQKKLLSIALGSIISTSTTQALNLPETYVMDFNGVFTLLDPSGYPIENSSPPYYDDPTWGLWTSNTDFWNLYYQPLHRYWGRHDQSL